MIYLASGIVCLCVGVAYVVGLLNGFTRGYDAALDDLENLAKQIRESVNNKNEE